MRLLTIILTLILTCSITFAQTDIQSHDSAVVENLLKDICDKYNQKHKNKELIRTTDNDSILQKYINIYKQCGGRQYIISLQHNFKLKQINDTTYQVKIKDTGQLIYEDQAEWQSFLWCTIGKPNGTVILIDGDGNKRLEYNYKDEMLNGRVAIWSKNGTLLSEDIYINDNKKEN